jgi:hypothetical protein
MYEDRERTRVKGGTEGTLYVNASNPIIQSLANLDVLDPELRDVVFALYHNALMLTSQGARAGLTPGNARLIFEGNNRTISSLINKIQELKKLKAHNLPALEHGTGSKTASDAPPYRTSSQSSSLQQEHVTCFVAIPFDEKYDSVLEALRDVLEVAPYYWQVARADQKLFKQHLSRNVAEWIARAHCYVADITDQNGNVMMELGHAYWGYHDRPLVIIHQKGRKRHLIDLADSRRIEYPWGDPPDQKLIAQTFRTEIANTDELWTLRKCSMPRYLSTRIFSGSGAHDRVTESITQKYSTVEAFLGANLKTMSATTGFPEGMLSHLQKFVKDNLNE